jgi:hypothetical protein
MNPALSAISLRVANCYDTLLGLDYIRVVTLFRRSYDRRVSFSLR